MTARTHTPGPWRFDERGNLVTDDLRGMRLGTYVESSGLGYSAEPNKKLIAAAPDLLEALRLMLDVQTRRRHPLGSPDEGIAVDAAETVSKARAATAKAEPWP